MPSYSLHRQILTWVVAASFLLAFPALAADDAPTPGPAVSDEGPDAAPRLDVSTATSIQKPLPTVAPVLRRMEGIAGDKGSMFTDRGFGLPSAGPTALERMKLERARMAIEAARTSGLLFSVRKPEFEAPFSQEEREIAKMRALEAMAHQKRVPGGDPIALPGAPARALQLRGPDGLTDFERRKLDAIRSGLEFTEVVSRREAPKEAARPTIDEGRKDGKEDR